VILWFSAFPAQTFTAVFCKALPKQNEMNHGLLIPITEFTAFKLIVASSSLWPPERKKMPTNAGGTVLDKARTVLAPISSALIFSLPALYLPGVTILGFKIHPSRKTLLSFKALKVAARTFSVIF